MPAVGPIRQTTQMVRGKLLGVKRWSYNFTPQHLLMMAQEQVYLTLQAVSNACLLHDADTIDLAGILIVFWRKIFTYEVKSGCTSETSGHGVTSVNS